MKSWGNLHSQNEIRRGFDSYLHIALFNRLIVVPIIFLSAVESEWHWQPVDRSFSLPIIPSGGIKDLTSKFDLCVTGEVM